MSEDVQLEVDALRSLLGENNVRLFENDPETDENRTSVTVWVVYFFQVSLLCSFLDPVCNPKLKQVCWSSCYAKTGDGKIYLSFVSFAPLLCD